LHLQVLNDVQKFGSSLEIIAGISPLVQELDKALPSPIKDRFWGSDPFPKKDLKGLSGDLLRYSGSKQKRSQKPPECFLGSSGFKINPEIPGITPPKPLEEGPDGICFPFSHGSSLEGDSFISLSP
jgi:hypothetical protein